ncbi:uncharacterized protein LOC125960790 [Orcinus orca]|uniref:uncharacterized protein LOC125960790 n=1 Tax=Orcinus orca TaxID=9733 RepID=UPI00211251F4|nr:uncharacterized protein LOC125960790 [Orcinus orca]
MVSCAAPQPHPLILESCSYNCLCQEQGGSRTGPGKHLAGAGLQHPLLETNSARIWKQPECSTLEAREGGWRRLSVGCSVLGQTVRGHLGPVTTRGQGALSQSHHGAAGPGCERRSARATAGGADGETEAPRGKQGPDKLGLVTPAPHPAWTLEHRAGLGEAGGIRLQPPSRLHEGQKLLPGGRWVSLDPAPCTVQLPGWAGMWGGHLGYSRHLERAAASWEGAPSTWKPEDVGAPPAHPCPLLWESASTPLLADCRAGAPRVGDLLLGESWGLSELGSGIPRACTLPASPGKLWSACSCPAPGWAAPCLPVPAGTAPGGSQAAGR